MHAVFEDVETAVSARVVHIADAAGQDIRSHDFTRVGLLGTRFTMEASFYRRRLEEQFGIEVIVPTPHDRDEVHRIIYRELCRGIQVVPQPTKPIVLTLYVVCHAEAPTTIGVAGNHISGCGTASIVSQDSRRRYLTVIDDLKHQGAEGVILGCTEIPLLVSQQDTDTPLFNTTLLHVSAAAETYLSG